MQSVTDSVPKSGVSVLINGGPQRINGSLPIINGIAKAKGSAFANNTDESEISELATVISTNTAKINDYLKANHLPFPSFHEDGPIDLGLSAEAEKARNAALEATAQLHDLLRGPVELIRPTVCS